MAEDIEFYNDEVELSRQVVREKPPTKLIQALIDLKIVKTELQANILIVIFTIIAFALSLFFFYVGSQYNVDTSDVLISNPTDKLPFKP